MSTLAPRSLARGIAEVVIVVLGILIAFGLDSWWDARKAAAWERVELQSLREEFTANVEHIGNVLGAHEKTVAGVESIFEFAAGTPGATSVFPDTVLTLMITWRTSEIATGTLDALLASGDLGKLRNPELRRDLAGLKAWVLDAQEKEVLARDFIEFVITPALLGQELLAPAYAARPPWGSAFPSRSVELDASAELRDLAAARLAHLNLAIVSQVRLQDALREILTLLDEELAPAAAPAPADDLAQQLIGSWEGRNETRGSMSFLFSPGGTATWVVPVPAGPETLHVSYVAVERDGLLLLDLSGFETGPLVGLVMYGLVEFEGANVIRMDLEPGPPGDPESRPTGLTSADVLTLEREPTN